MAKKQVAKKKVAKKKVADPKAILAKSSAGRKWQTLSDQLGDEEISLIAGFYHTSCVLLGLDDDWAKEEIFGFSGFDDFAEYQVFEGPIKVLDVDKIYGKVFETDLDDFDKEENDGLPTFDQLFPGCLPIAFDRNADEFFFVDTRRKELPVLFWCHEGVVAAAASLAAFLAEIAQ